MFRPLTLMFPLLALFAGVAYAGDCCDQCGCQSCCRKVCRLVCETKQVPHTTYTCECEDFCVPGPSERCGTKCECDSCGCGKCDHHCHKTPIYKPTCATVHTRTRLIKHVEMKEELHYKWVVQSMCDHCAGGCAQEVPVSEPSATAESAPEIQPYPQTSPAASRPAAQKVSFLEKLFGGK